MRHGTYYLRIVDDEFDFLTTGMPRIPIHLHPDPEHGWHTQAISAEWEGDYPGLIVETDRNGEPVIAASVGRIEQDGQSYYWIPPQ